MKNLTITFLTFLFVVILGTQIALAKEGSGGKDKKPDLKAKITTQLEHVSQFLKAKVNNETFDIQGEIESASETSFIVGGQTIIVDPTMVAKFTQKGILEEGQRVKVRGIITEDGYLAQDINVIGTGQGRYQFKFENGVVVTPTPDENADDDTQDATPSASPSPTPQGSLNSGTDGLIGSLNSDTETTTGSLDSSTERVTTRIRISGTLERVRAFIDNLFSYFSLSF
ncbi:MAG: DUF5666 domain-containing protein [Patescibacteria group bacterium]